ncbi:rhodanese-like domain-containing protein [Halobacteria archaeon AArc-m2/3/4]|uniref:Rhodanese-like domain-containing protein n=1 Tax=Natronoglomus mannanivorans TaxID=2979990 RepID=A0ABT2QFF4_9EURY|nr:rhodanese-like domain-containing protein [Halobacteria archaeon AArc-m2/3/4]
MVTTLTAERLAEMQDDDEAFVLVDTRPEESFEAWHVRGALNFPFGPEEELDGKLEEFHEFVDDNGAETDRIVTICAKGISSGNFATQLESATDEYDVQAVEGGMKDWSGVYDHVSLGSEGEFADELASDELTIVQVQRRAKGCLGYVVGCPETGEAIVVDPTDDTDEYKIGAEEHDLTITGVVDTHVHADHLSGGRALAEEMNVPYYMGERAADRDLAYEYTSLARNEVLEVGDLEVKALAAPGHTSEMINLLVGDSALLTADTLHVDSTGRTELEFGADEGEQGAHMLYETLHRTILAEPESVVVLPGHVSVRADGEFEHGSPGEAIATTIHAARTGIDVLGLEEDEFVDRLANPGEKPANYEEIIELNRGVVEEPPEDRVELELGPNNCSA